MAKAFADSNNIGVHMNFCPKCGNLIIAEKKDGKLKNICRKCGYTPREKGVSTVISENMEQKQEKIIVVEKDEELKQYPKAKILCPKCGHKEAYWYLQQTRGGDEPQTKFLCCTKCGYRWREY